jgi:hypothetical protein
MIDGLPSSAPVFRLVVLGSMSASVLQVVGAIPVHVAKWLIAENLQVIDLEI